MKQDDKFYNEWLGEGGNVEAVVIRPGELTTGVVQQGSMMVPRS